MKMCYLVLLCVCLCVSVRIIKNRFSAAIYVDEIAKVATLLVYL